MLPEAVWRSARANGQAKDYRGLVLVSEQLPAGVSWTMGSTMMMMQTRKQA